MVSIVGVLCEARLSIPEIQGVAETPIFLSSTIGYMRRVLQEVEVKGRQRKE
jgi:hypothetical protein